MIWALFAAVSDNLQAGKAFQLLETLQKELVIQMEGKPVGKYMFKHDASSKKTYHDTYKPFLHVIDPETGITLTKGPGGQFTHHRGISVSYTHLTLPTKRIV